MAYGSGLKAIRRLVEEANSYAWHTAKLSPVLFKPYEQPIFQWVDDFVRKHHALPQLDTIIEQFPDVGAVQTPEPASYYVQILENSYCYERINKANLESQDVLKKNQDDHEKALNVLKDAERDIRQQKFRLRILDVGKEAPELVLKAYGNVGDQHSKMEFGWPYLDTQSGQSMPGEVSSIVGRPATGKTFCTLWTAMHNFLQEENVLYVSMEMATLPIAQRITAMYAHQNIQQLKTASFSDNTLKKFYAGLKALQKEQGKLYVIDGSLAANAEEVYALADVLKCTKVIIDGGYLLRHRNKRLNRYERAAENAEMIKTFSTDLQVTTLSSWQFNRTASSKQKKSGQDTADIDDIGYTDVIGQISSIVLGMFQEEGIETLKERKIKVMKGRNGESGQFSIEWDFIGMNFHQSDPPLHQETKPQELQWL